MPITLLLCSHSLLYDLSYPLRHHDPSSLFHLVLQTPLLAGHMQRTERCCLCGPPRLAIHTTAVLRGSRERSVLHGFELFMLWCLRVLRSCRMQDVCVM